MSALKLYYAFLSGGVPVGFVVLPLVLLALLYIWHAVYHHSGLIKADLYRKGNWYITVTLISVYMILWSFLEAPKSYERLLVLPLTNQSASTDQWIGPAISGSVEHMLWTLGDPHTAVIKQEWLESLDRFRPLTDTDTIRAALERFVPINYLISGSYRPDADGAYKATVVFTDLLHHKKIREMEFAFTREGIFDVNLKIAEQAAQWCNLKAVNKKKMADITRSLAAYQEYQLGWDGLKHHDSTRACQHLEKAAALDPLCAYAQIRLAQLYRERAQPLTDSLERKPILQRAIYHGSKAVTINHELSDAFTGLAWSYIFLEHWMEADNGLQIAYHLQPLDPVLYYLLSKMHQDRYGYYKLKNTEAVLEKAVIINPVYIPAQLCLIDRYNRITLMPLEAGKLNDWVLAVEPLNAEANLTRSLTCIYHGQYREAIEACRKVLAIDPQKAEAYYNMGISFKSLQERDSAIVCLKQAVAMKYVNAYNYLAATYEEKKEYYTAIKYLRQRVQVNDRNDQGHKSAVNNLYRLVHKPGIVVDSNFEFQRLPVSPSMDSASMLLESRKQ